MPRSPKKPPAGREVRDDAPPTAHRAGIRSATRPTQTGHAERSHVAVSAPVGDAPFEDCSGSRINGVYLVANGKPDQWHFHNHCPTDERLVCRQEIRPGSRGRQGCGVHGSDLPPLQRHHSRRENLVVSKPKAGRSLSRASVAQRIGRIGAAWLGAWKFFRSRP